MAVIVPVAPIVTPFDELVRPLAGEDPFATALENCNYFYANHRPPLISVCPNMSGAITRNSSYILPISPSQDGLRYNLRVVWSTSVASQGSQVSWWYTTSYAGSGGTVWVALQAAISITSSATANEPTVYTDSNRVIPATAVALKVTFTAVGSGTRKDHHILVQPAEISSMTSTVKASGFIPYDDGLLTDADRAPLHTEWLARMRWNLQKVMTDRAQCLFSWVQDGPGVAPHTPISSVDTITTLGNIRCYLPHQVKAAAIRITVLATVTGGSTTGRVTGRVEGAPGSLVPIIANADDTLQTIDASNIQTIQEQGGPPPYLIVRLRGTATTGQTLRIAAVFVHWFPGGAY